MQKTAVLASKLRSVKTFKYEKCYFTLEKVIEQLTTERHGWTYYDKDLPLTTSVW